MERVLRRGPLSRSALAVLVLLVAVTGVMAATAAPAGAHAVLIASTPGNGERLAAPPDRVSLTFSGPVSVELGGVRVIDGEKRRVDLGTVNQPTPQQLLIGLEPDLAEGTYLVGYRVVSEDGHHITGAVVFAVGDVLDADAVAGLGEAEQPMAEAVGVTGRALAYLGAMLAAGLVLFALFVHDGGDDRARLAPLVRVACAVAALGSTLNVVAQAALQTGRGLTAASDGEVLRGVLRQGGLGWSVAVLLAGLALLYAVAGLSRGALAQGVGFYGALVVSGSFVLWGHTSEMDARVLLSLADGVHVLVAAAWLGGLVGLALLLSWRRPDRPLATGDEAHGPGEPGIDPSATAERHERDDPVLDTAGVVVRFSTLAALSVVLLWTTGAVLAWQTVGDPGNLLDQPYGQALLLKVNLVLVVLALAAWNRYRLVPALLAAEPPTAEAPPAEAAVATGDGLDDRGATAPDLRLVDDDGVQGHRWALLARTVRWEAGLLVAVVMVTAVLVSLAPARDTAAATGPYSARLPVTDGIQLDITVSPAVTGRNMVHLTYLDADDRPVDAAEQVTVRLALPSAELGPIEVEAPKAGTGHHLVTTDAFSIAGTWDVTIVTRLDEFTEERTAVPVVIGSG